MQRDHQKEINSNKTIKIEVKDNYAKLFIDNGFYIRRKLYLANNQQRLKYTEVEKGVNDDLNSNIKQIDNKNQNFNVFSMIVNFFKFSRHANISPTVQNVQNAEISNADCNNEGITSKNELNNDIEKNMNNVNIQPRNYPILDENNSNRDSGSLEKVLGNGTNTIYSQNSLDNESIETFEPILATMNELTSNDRTEEMDLKENDQSHNKVTDRLNVNLSCHHNCDNSI